MSTSRVKRAIEDVAAGKMIILVDDEDRENEGDLVLAAEACTPEAINFMVTHARGLVCLTLTEARTRQLGLPLMVKHNRSAFETGFTVSIEAASGVSSGISAHDRATTVKAAIAPEASPEDIVAPGHIFPIQARNGGVLVRTGHTEGSVDLARLAGRFPAAVICEIMNEDGSMARLPDLEAFAEKHGLSILSIEELIAYRMAQDSVVEPVVQRELNTPFGEVSVSVFKSTLDGREHLAIQKGDLKNGHVPLVRVDALDMPADLIDLTLCGGQELSQAFQEIDKAGAGVVLFLSRACGPSGLSDRVARLGERRELEQPMDMRAFGVGAQILRQLGVSRFNLLSQRKLRMIGLEGFGLELLEQLPMPDFTPAVEIKKESKHD